MDAKYKGFTVVYFLIVTQFAQIQIVQLKLT